MTPTEKTAPPRAQKRPPGKPRASRKRRRARRNRRVAAVATLATLALGLIGLGIWLGLERRPEATVELYPVEYEQAIRQCAAQNGIDPAWPAAVILAESSYQPEAVSGADARGLMQLLPDTARWVSGKLGEDFAEEGLFDPETNIRYGCWYLGYLSRRFGGDMTCATAAYHAGQGQVDKWLADPACSPDGRTLESIPSVATDTYVKRVLRYYEKYAQLYAPAA